jgi:hypothetical protein
MLWTYFAAQSWALWTTKNKFTIEGKFPRQPANRVFQFLINLQLWCHSKKLEISVDGGTGGDVKNLFANTYNPSTPPAHVSGG